MRKRNMFSKAEVPAPSAYRNVLTFSVFFAMISAESQGGKTPRATLTLTSTPIEPLAGQQSTGDAVKLLCTVWTAPGASDISVTLNRQRPAEYKGEHMYMHYMGEACPRRLPQHNESIVCQGSASDCEGVQTEVFYQNCTLKILVTMAHFRCRHRGNWTCAADVKSPRGVIRLKDALRFTGLSLPSNIMVTAERASGDGHVVTMVGTQMVLWCRGNVGSPSGKMFFSTFHHEAKSETNEQAEFGPSEVSDYVRVERNCTWIRAAKAVHNVTEDDEHKTFRCGVKYNNHRKIFMQSEVVVFLTQSDQTTWHAIGSAIHSDISNPLALSSREVSTAQPAEDCTADVWLIFGVAAGGLLALVVIIESIYYLHKKTNTVTLNFG